MASTIIRERKRRELDPTVAFLRSSLDELEGDGETPPAVKARIKTLLELSEDLSGWYDQLAKLPRASLTKLIRMGAGISKLLGR